MNAARTSQCPSDLTLEEHLLRPNPATARHITGCAHCQSWERAAAEASGAFARQHPRWMAKARPSPLRRWAPLLATAALAAVALVLLHAPSPELPRYATKGDELTVYIGGQGAPRAATQGEHVRPGESLRFQVAPGAAAFVWIASVDATGAVSRLVPAEGTTPLAVDGTQVLPGSAVLDAAEGPERIWAVISPEPLGWTVVEQALQGSPVRDPTAVHIPGARTSTVLLERGAP
ncbi:hypothetical protein SAMN05443572_11923 [Myxococcus fulvus]|uniref:DUF4384 domain-containing protein n=1 Tax=Myxococcus fulvus TaxID=33 RepID=A0A511TGE3_MYXFU|nr:hypothetical protein [Myxococcus fulvus]GEN13230.1 hypothetical protein MFU01_82670 [Myxococcus fulvus]SEU42296.1 hypothetical protein SAMN05443572_11923 [Myxococcus fulvus]